MSESERTALLIYHAAEIQKLLTSKPVEEKVVIKESLQNYVDQRLSKFKTKK